MPKPEKPLEKNVVEKMARNPKCARCRNHGFVVQLKGHSGKCQFFLCNCWKCSLITERTKIMAIQRRIKKNQKEESSTSIGINREEAQLKTSGNVDDTAEDSVNIHDITTAALVRPTQDMPSSNVRTESVIKMPAPRIELDGKIYAELEVPMRSLNEGATNADGSHEQKLQPTDIRGGCPGGSPWNAMHDGPFFSRTPARFPSDYVFAEVASRDMYPGELMSVPLPFKLYSRYPNSYPCQTILMKVPTLGSGPFKDPAMGFPHLQSCSLPYAPEPCSSHDERMPFFHPYSTLPPGFPEELVLRNLTHSTGFFRGREQGADTHIQGNQESDVSVERGSPSQDTP